MKGRLVRIGAAVLFVTVLLLVAVVVVPSRRSLFIGIYELVIAAIVVLNLIGSFRTFEPQAWLRSPFEREPEPPEEPEPIPELDRIDRTVVLGAANEFDLHYRLRPLLRKLAAERLLAKRGIDLDREPDRARALLGDELWELVQPDRKLGRRTGPGLPPSLLAVHVTRLEQL
jgi:hypothetical protein